MRYRNAIVLLPVLLAGCASMTTPYSEVTGERFSRSIADRRAVNIVSVGEFNGWANNSPVQVPPGNYRVVVESRGHGGFRGRQAEMTLNVAPCNRYFINAQFAGQIGPEFTPVIDHVEPIGGCKRPG